MFEILYRTLVTMTQERDTTGVLASDLHKRLKADGITMNRDAFAALLYDWEQYERRSKFGERVIFHSSTSGRLADAYSFHWQGCGPFVCGAISLA